MRVYSLILQKRVIIIKKLIVLLLAFCLAVLSICAMNDPVGTGITITGETNLNESPQGENITGEGGNVTILNMTSTMSTGRWQGYVGNITAILKLGAGTDLLHNFGNANVDLVIATTQSGTFDWGNLELASVADVDTVWGFAGGADQAVDVFNDTQTIENIANVPSRKMNDVFYASVMDDGNNAAKTDFAFLANIIMAGAVGLGGDIFQYELVVPTTTEGYDTYWFYLSLDE